MTYSGERILLSSQREGQVSRFHTWVLLVVPLVAILFQVYVPRFFPYLSFLEMPLLVVVYFAIMRRSQISGLMVGALVGLAQDSLTKARVTIHTFQTALVDADVQAGKKIAAANLKAGQDAMEAGW